MEATVPPPSLELFECSKLNLKLTVGGCARLWASANGPKAPMPHEGRAMCRGCPLGSLHATGRLPNPMMAVTAALSKLCSRCFRQADRLIWNRFCPSCDARDREALKEKNSKGNRPALCDQLHTVRVSISTGDEPARIVAKARVTGISEVIVQAAKHATAPMAFGRPSCPALPLRKPVVWQASAMLAGASTARERVRLVRQAPPLSEASRMRLDAYCA